MIVGGTEAAFDGPGGSSGSAAGKGNVIPRTALARGDLRFASAAQLQQARERMTAIVARNLRRTSAKITFDDSYPAMEATPGNLALLAQLDQVSRDLGYGKVEACDPRARGGGAHTPGDYADLKSLPELTKRTAILIYRLTR